ncbi:MAG: metallophosphoesterase family protein, partial [Armatimonadota bacterium]
MPRKLLRYRAPLLMFLFVALPGLADTGPWVQPDTRQADAALEYLADHQPAGDRFTFCAIADTQTSKPTVPKEITRRAVGEMELLDTNFVIASGDQIRGYTGDEALIHRMWDAHLELTNSLPMPWVPVPGNHDIWGWDSHEIYQDRIGPTAFS